MPLHARQTLLDVADFQFQVEDTIRPGSESAAGRSIKSSTNNELDEELAVQCHQDGVAFVAVDPSARRLTLNPGCRNAFSPSLESDRTQPAFLTTLTAAARDKTAMTSLRLLAVLNVRSCTPARAKRLAPRPDGPLTHFVSPRGEKCRSGRDRCLLLEAHSRLIAVAVDDDDIVLAEITVEDGQRQRVLDEPLDRALQRTRAEFLVIAVGEQ